jgi:tripartite-type tricarboxylate transporter receptor subunit TctC
MKRRQLNLATMLAALLALAPMAASAAWPDKPIRIIVAFPPGGGVDVLARLLGSKLSTLLGQPVLVDNKPGADTQIGTALVAQAPADGYTIGVLTSTIAINKALYPNLPYDAAKDFTPVANIAISPYYLVSWPGLEAKTLKDLIALAKKKPGQLNYASSSADGFLAGEMMNKAAGISTVHVRYKGTPPSLLAVMTGEVSYSYFTLLGIKSQVEAKKLNVLGVSSAQRSRDMPNVPTLAEAGAPGYDTTVWFAVFAPAGMPAEITTKLNAAFNQIIDMPDVKAKIESLGATPTRQSPQEFASFVNAEIAKYAAVVKENKLRAD